MKRILMIGALSCAACAGGEEIDFGAVHASGGSNLGGNAGTSSTGTAGQSVGTSGSTGRSGNNEPSGSGGSGGSGGTPQTDAAAGGSGLGVGGSSGASGATGSGGSGGSASSDAGFIAGFSVLYKAEDSHATTSYVQVELHAKNGGSSSAQIGELKVRYYFTDDVMKTAKITINWSHVTTGAANGDLAVSSAVAPLVPTTTQADSYIEFGFSGGHSLLAPGESADFSWRMNGPNEGTDVYTQSNDYSFDASKTAVTAWDHVVLVRNGTVVWGTPP